MTLLLRWLKTREDGQDLLEYGILVSLIAIVALAAVSDLADTIIDVFWGQIVGLPF
jgi:Flp pilus assembly pilin Flp